MMNNYFLILVHPCDTESNGGCNQICNKTNNKYNCACNEGFVLEKDGKSCIKGRVRYSFTWI